MQGHRQPAPRGAGDRDRAGLRGAHHRADVLLAEHPLHGHRVGPARVQPGLDLGLDREQPGRDVLVGRRPDDPDPDHGQRPARCALDHADAAPGQPGIDPQHPDRVPRM
jgi:hypothetical protein